MYLVGAQGEPRQVRMASRSVIGRRVACKSHVEGEAVGLGAFWGVDNW